MTYPYPEKAEDEIYLGAKSYTDSRQSQYNIVTKLYEMNTGQSASNYAQAMLDAEEDKRNIIGAGIKGLVDWVLTPLSAPSDALLAPIAYDYKEGEGLIKGLQVSGEAFLKTLIPGWKDDEQPHYARQIVDKYMEDATEIKKTSAAFGLDLLADPTILLGFTALKIFQKGLRTAGMGSRLARYNATQPAKTFLQQMGTKTDGSIGTLEEGLIRLYTDVGEGMTPLGKDLQKLARAADRGDAQAHVKFMDEVGKHDEVMNLAQITDVKELGDFNKMLKLTLGASDTDAVTFNKHMTSDQFKKSLDTNYLPVKTPNFSLAALTDEESTVKALKSFQTFFDKEFNKQLKTLSKGEQDLLMAQQSLKLKDMFTIPIKNVEREQMYGMRMTMMALFDLTNDAALKILKNDPMGEILFRNYSALAEIMMGRVSSVSRLWGSQLRSLKFKPKEGDVLGQFTAMKKLVNEAVVDDKTHAKLVKLIAAKNDPLAIAALLENKFTTKKGLDSLFEVFVNNILSSPLTHMVNITSTAFRMALEPLSSLFASGSALARFDAVASKEHFLDTFRQMGGALEGFTDVLRLGGQKLSGGRIFGNFDYPIDIGVNTELAKFKYRPTINAENFGATGAWGSILDKVGWAVRVPGNFLMKEDTVMKMAAYRMKVNTYAARLAKEQGKNTAHRKALFREFKKTPPNSLNKMAMGAADDMLFHTRLGEKGEAFNKMIKKVPGTRWMIPFFRTPTNLVHEGMKHTPFGLMYSSMRKHVTATTMEGDLVRAKLALGPMMAGGVMAFMGENVTGYFDTRSPSGKFKADQGQRPYSIRSGDIEFHYESIEPLRFMLGMFANLRDIVTNIDMDDPNEELIAKEAFDSVIGAFVAVSTDNYMLQNIGQIYHILSSASDGNPDRFIEALTDIAISTAIPQAVTQWNKQKSNYFMQADTVLEKIRKRVWGASPDLYFHRNAYGEKIEIPHGMGADTINELFNNNWIAKSFDAYSPFRGRVGNIDPISQEIIDLGVQMRGQIKTIQGIILNPSERDQVNKFAGQGVEGTSIREILRDQMNTHHWELVPKEIRSKIVFNTFSRYRSIAKSYVFATNERLQHEKVLMELKKAQRLQSEGM